MHCLFNSAHIRTSATTITNAQQSIGASTHGTYVRWCTLTCMVLASYVHTHVPCAACVRRLPCADAVVVLWVSGYQMNPTLAHGQTYTAAQEFTEALVRQRLVCVYVINYIRRSASPSTCVCYTRAI